VSPSLILKYLADLPRTVKALFLICFDFVVLCISMLLAFAVRFDPASLEYQLRNFFEGVWILIAVQMLALLISGLYRSVLRHAGSELLVLLLRSILLGAGLFALMDLMLEEYRIPRSIIVMSAAFSFLGLLSTRLMIRWVVRLHVVEPQQREKLQRVAIYGAGSAGYNYTNPCDRKVLISLPHLWMIIQNCRADASAKSPFCHFPVCRHFMQIIRSTGCCSHCRE